VSILTNLLLYTDLIQKDEIQEKQGKLEAAFDEIEKKK
jgi:hypothetical protein